MLSVMDTHHFEDITYEFQPGKEIIPFLAPTKYANFSAEPHKIYHMYMKLATPEKYTIMNIIL